MVLRQRPDRHRDLIGLIGHDPPLGHREPEGFQQLYDPVA
jgi:hypothetical protein